MKKTIIILLFGFTSIVSAQRHSALVTFGHFKPSATEGGFILGYKGETFIDRNLSIGWSASWFSKSYVDKVLLKQYEQYYGIVNGELSEQRSKTNLHSIPLLASMTAYLPVFPIISLYITGSAGAEALLIFYNNLQNEDQNEFKTAWDFSWQLGAGIAYKIGNRSDLVGEISYHNSNPSWTYTVTDPETGATKHLEQSFDMSGVALKFGFKFFW
ncbi:MAG: outer membrane beta-barrel protein [Chlorobi bacterium]|nr:outer membrane beta-barrel protein [Chlorobiota bacterium]